MAAVPEKRPQTFTSFVETIEGIHAGRQEPLWFRGCGNSSYQLLPGLYRHSTVKSSDDLAKLEAETMARFRQRSIPFTDRSLSEDWEALFFMQHYRVPTRLLDWSENPFFAFYFAVMNASFQTKRAGPRYNDDAAIWVLDPVSWNRHALRHQSFDGGVLITKSEELKPYQPAPAFAGMLNDPVALYGAHNSPRIVAQRGVFTIFGKNLIPMESAYDSAAYPADCLTKIVLERDKLSAMRKSILAYGITESVVYPDLDGLAAEIRRSFGFEA